MKAGHQGSALGVEIGTPVQDSHIRQNSGDSGFGEKIQKFRFLFSCSPSWMKFASVFNMLNYEFVLEQDSFLDYRYIARYYAKKYLTWVHFWFKFFALLCGCLCQNLRHD